MSRLLEWVTLATAMGCGLSAGVFFAFSAFVMPALARLPAGHAIAAMQSINRMAVTPAFMMALSGTALACLALGIHAVVTLGERPAVYMLAGSALYLVGTIGVTAAHHVPLNDALATVRPDAADGAGRWSGYLSGWNSWNQVRAACGLAAAGLLTAALRVG